MTLTNRKQYQVNDNTTITIFEYEKCLFAAHLCTDMYYYITPLFTIEAEALAEAVKESSRVLCAL